MTEAAMKIEGDVPTWSGHDKVDVPTGGTEPAGYDEGEGRQEDPYGDREIGPGGEGKGA
jgi:hypothetical protein